MIECQSCETEFETLNEIERDSFTARLTTDEVERCEECLLAENPPTVTVTDMTLQQSGTTHQLVITVSVNKPYSVVHINHHYNPVCIYVNDELVKQRADFWHSQEIVREVWLPQYDTEEITVHVEEQDIKIVDVTESDVDIQFETSECTRSVVSLEL